MRLPVPRDTQLRRVYHAPHALMGSYLTPTRVHFPTANVGVPGRLLPSSARMSLHRIGSFRTPYGALRKAEEVGGIVGIRDCRSGCRKPRRRGLEGSFGAASG